MPKTIDQPIQKKRKNNEMKEEMMMFCSDDLAKAMSRVWRIREGLIEMISCGIMLIAEDRGFAMSHSEADIHAECFAEDFSEPGRKCYGIAARRGVEPVTEKRLHRARSSAKNRNQALLGILQFGQGKVIHV
jgi:hypothetical protein